VGFFVAILRGIVRRRCVSLEVAVHLPLQKNDRKSGSKKSMSHHRNEDPDIFYRNGGVFRCRLNGLVFIRNFRFPGLRKKSVGDTEKIREIYGR